MDRRPVIVGLCPRNDCLEPLSPDYPSGRRLSQMCGVTPDEFRKSFCRINLYDSPLGGNDDEEAADRIAPYIDSRRVIALGGRVSKALKLPNEFFNWTLGYLDPTDESGGEGARFVGTSCPHPSGRNLWWNEEDNVELARGFFRGVLRPCVHVEGPDGAGKSLLVDRISKNVDLRLVGTEGPPSSWTECVKRVRARVTPGIICDRSSGLISEMIYGPVIRGRTLGPMYVMRELLLSLKHVVQFIYCRPPLDAIRHVPREGEDPTHISAVEVKMVSLLSAYDRMFEWMEECGMGVIRYDWTSDNEEEVIKKCVE